MTPWPSWSSTVRGAVTVLCCGVLATTARAGTLSATLERSLAHRGTHADVAVIVRMAHPLDVMTLATGDRSQRDNRLLLALQARAARNRTAIEPELVAAGGTRVRDLWLINGLAVTLPAYTLKTLAALPGVATIDVDAFVQGGRSQRTPVSRGGPALATPSTASAAAVPAPDFLHAHPGWNLTSMHVPEVWARGHTGQGVVVATMDTGVDLEHPDLRHKWRGGNNSWYDPHGEEPTPYDALGHGTQALGVVLGSPDMGVAPQARWIAARLYNGDGRASMSDIHLVFQWLLDPDGDPATLDAPDVVNASWALTGRATGSCIMEFSDDIQALKSAGIAVVFAAGNDGPFPNTSNSPGNNPGVLSVGAVDSDQALARQTSRGPSACDGGVFPRLVAPGVQIRTADLSHGGQSSYTTVSGSSLAAPHVAGVLALLAGAFPSASVSELEAALIAGAQDLGAPGSGPVYRFGRVDALGAFNALLAKQGAALSGPGRLALQQ